MDRDQMTVRILQWFGYEQTQQIRKILDSSQFILGDRFQEFLALFPIRDEGKLTMLFFEKCSPFFASKEMSFPVYSQELGNCQEFLVNSFLE